MGDIEKFIDTYTAGCHPACCYLYETYDDYSSKASMCLRISPHMTHRCNWLYESNGLQLKFARTRLEEHGWRVFQNEADWDAYVNKGRKRVPATLAELKAAYELFGHNSFDEIEIDDDALISDAREDAGRWVQAWVWVSDEDLKGEEDE